MGPASPPTSARKKGAPFGAVGGGIIGREREGTHFRINEIREGVGRRGQLSLITNEA